MPVDRTAAIRTTLGLLVVLATTRPAWAYIDPNTGGLLFNWLAGSLVAISGGILLLGGYIRGASARVRRLVRERIRGRRPEGSPPQAAAHRNDRTAANR